MIALAKINIFWVFNGRFLNEKPQLKTPSDHKNLKMVKAFWYSYSDKTECRRQP